MYKNALPTPVLLNNLKKYTMKKIFTKIYIPSKEELAVELFGIVLFIISAFYLANYAIEVG